MSAEESDICVVGMARYHNFGFGTIPECNTSVFNKLQQKQL